MSARVAAWLPWSACAACVVLTALALLLDFLTVDVPFPFIPRLGPGFAVLTGMLSLAFPHGGSAYRLAPSH
jgi:hypothetical protein